MFRVGVPQSTNRCCQTDKVDDDDKAWAARPGERCFIKDCTAASVPARLGCPETLLFRHGAHVTLH